MKKQSSTFKQARRDNHILDTRKHDITPRHILLALAFGLICALSIYFLSVPASAYDLDPTLSLSFSGGTIRVKYFQDDSINFADDLTQEAVNQLFDGQLRRFDSQILIYVTDNAVLNYALDDPIEIITLAQSITQQILFQSNLRRQQERTNEQLRPDRNEEQYYYDENNERQFYYENEAIRRDQEESEERIRAELDYIPDHLTFIIFNSALAIVYQYQLWTSDNYFEEAVRAIDRAEDDSGGGFYEITEEDYITVKEGGNTLVYPRR